MRIDPFAYPAENETAVEVATWHADHAAKWQELATEQMENVDGRQYGQRSQELVLQFAELNLQRAQVSALLAIAHELTALRSHMPQVAGARLELNQLATAVDGLAGAVDYVADPRPRWWQWTLRRALRQQDTKGGEPR
jgi:hypothetical protein